MLRVFTPESLNDYVRMAGPRCVAMADGTFALQLVEAALQTEVFRQGMSVVNDPQLLLWTPPF